MTKKEEKQIDTPGILFFCRECQKLTKEPKKVGAKYAYNCPVCKSDNVAFGTRKSICSYFHLKDRDLEEVYGEEVSKVTK